MEVAEWCVSIECFAQNGLESVTVLHLLDSQFCAAFTNVALCLKQFPIDVTNPNEVLYLLPDFSAEGFQMHFHLYMPLFYPQCTLKCLNNVLYFLFSFSGMYVERQESRLVLQIQREESN